VNQRDEFYEKAKRAIRAGLLTAEPDLSSEKMREAEYRRGYADGWAAATEEMWTQMFGKGLSRAEAYDACFDRWETELFDWQEHRRGALVL